ncbi:nuclear transport factor 2 family protein [Tenggerimyces flavus]|uniref:Nuclear transport factor 2 family protein n=1 Tax=Tenggerimyces flavus TaxID=1708749 RepID=A0ABV7YRC7_9ACTN|nr:nuclear transport factor 2 family protein [Tenggerimyces flavus]MBM7790194.1 putative SnoaL-like aldol condensation-catalyzing enzyme [Tenggerimyces flavus]
MADLEQNKQLVASYLHQVFNEKGPAEAFAKYIGDKYVQHNPMAPDGAEASLRFLTGFVAQFPELRLEIRRVIAEGDLVVTHSMMTMSPSDRGSAVMDSVRLEAGRIVEHWDVAQAIPKSSANHNTMF